MTMTTDTTPTTDTLADATRHYNWLSEANTIARIGRTPEAWDVIAARLESFLPGLSGDRHEFVRARAVDSRQNAQTLRVRAARA